MHIYSRVLYSYIIYIYAHLINMCTYIDLVSGNKRITDIYPIKKETLRSKDCMWIFYCQNV